MKTAGTLSLSSAVLAPLAAMFISGILSQAFTSDAMANSKTDNLPVTANVINNCVFTGTSTTLDLGTYDSVDVNYTSEKQASATFSIRCTKGASVSFALSHGQNATSSQRKLSMDPSNMLNYELYSDASYTTAWNLNSYPPAVISTGPSTPITKTIYALVPAGQDVTAGSYTDAVVVTALF